MHEHKWKFIFSGKINDVVENTFMCECGEDKKEAGEEKEKGSFLIKGGQYNYKDL